MRKPPLLADMAFSLPESRLPRVPARPVLVNLALGLVYLGLGYGTLALGEASGVELRRLLWLGSGVGLSVALLVPFPVWPGVAVGGFFVTFLSGDPLGHAVVTGAANALEIGLPRLILVRIGFDRSLERVRDVLLLVFLAAGVAAMLSALLSVVSLVLTGLAPASTFGRVWLLWWATHGTGMLVVTPPVLALWGAKPESTAYRVEFAAVLTALAVTGFLTFLAPADTLAARVFYLCFPFLVWCAVRLGVEGAATGGSVVTLLAIWGAETYRGPLVGETDSQTLFLTWTFSNSVILTTLLAGALLAKAKRAREDLLTGKRRLQVVLNTTKDAILVSDPAGVVLEANPGFRKLVGVVDDLTGTSAAEVLGRLAARAGPDGTAPTWLPSVPPSRGSADGLLTFSDGSAHEVHSAPMKSEEFSGRIWVFHDITERVRAEEERQRLQRQVLHSQKLEGLGLLAGGVAHDFNNLLTSILGHAELLLEDGLTDASREDARQIVETAGDAADLCRQMLAYAGKGQFSWGPVDLVACAQDTRRLLKVSLSPAVELTLDLPDHPILIEGDEVQVRQVLMNLVTNASDAVASLGTRGRIEVRAEVTTVDRGWLSRALVDDGLEPGTYALLEVEDNGMGMDEETASQIFDPFFSSKGTGRGLGLATTIGVVRGHRGAMRLDTAVGQGSRFRVVLPLLDAAVPARTR